MSKLENQSRQEESGRVGLQFFLYYVLWPGLTGSGIAWIALFQPTWIWYWAAFTSFVWLVYPIGRYRRRFDRIQLDEFEAEMKATGEIDRIGALMLALGSTFVLLLSMYVGLVTTPIIMEKAFGVDIPAIVKEAQARVEHERHPQPPELEGSARSEEPNLRERPVHPPVGRGRPRSR